MSNDVNPSLNLPVAKFVSFLYTISVGYNITIHRSKNSKEELNHGK